MADERASLRKPAVAERRAPAAARVSPVAATAHPAPAARALQQRLGNRGTQAVAGRIVARSSAPSAAPANATRIGSLSISEPDDAHEREADSVADKVMRMAEPPPTVPAPRGLPGTVIQRRCTECEEEGSGPKVQRKKSSASAAHITPSVSASINALKGGGQPLPVSTRTFFEPRFGTDFSGVRVHTDAHAARTASSISAKAFTVGRDIAFGVGEFSPHSRAGRHLLAHELTHVVQQDRSIARTTVQRDPQDPTPAPKDDAGLVAQLDDEIRTWEGNAKQDADLMLRARASRMVLLLKARTRPVLSTQQDLDNFTGDCDRRSRTELDTLGAFSPAAAEGALALVPKGFPLTWSGRVHAALTLGADPTTILKTSMEALTKLVQRSIALGPQLALRGLPVPYEELERLNNFGLRMSDSQSDKPSPVRDFAREGIRYTQLKWILAFAFAWETMVNNVAEAIADGTRVPNDRDYQDFIKNKQSILRDLPARASDRIARSDEEVEKIQTDALALADTALLLGMASALLSLFGILGGWQDVTAQFNAALSSGDSGVASASSGDRLIRAPQWAWENDYYSGAAAAAGRAMWQQAPEALEEMALYMALGSIPVLDIGLAIYLFFKLGMDVAEMLVELAGAIADITGAKTVTDLQKAAARLATILTRVAIFGAILAATYGVGRAVTKLRAGKAQAKAANPALSEEAATKKAMQQLSKEEREALEGSKVSTAKRVAEKLTEFSGVCRLGSILCDRVPEAIVKEVGPVPKTQYNVPSPKGPFNIQKSAFSTAERDSKFLQARVLEDPSRWPHFEKALKENGGKWPTDSNGKAWEVHHIKQVGMGGGSEIDNLFPLPKADHSILTNYWNSVRYAFQARFTKAEWEAIYTKSTKNVPGEDVPKAPLPKK